MSKFEDTFAKLLIQVVKHLYFITIKNSIKRFSNRYVLKILKFTALNTAKDGIPEILVLNKNISFKFCYFIHVIIN